MNFHNKHSLGDISPLGIILLSHHQQCSLSMWLCIAGFHVLSCSFNVCSAATHPWKID